MTIRSRLQTEVQKQTTTTEVVTTVELNETSTVESVTFTSQTSSTQQQVENSAAITIEEQVPEVHTKPSFNKELEYLTATEGSLVRLECCVAGDPRPNIKWLKNNEVIDPDNGYKIQRSEDGTVTLIIEGAEVEDSGSYTCVADNVAGTATTQSKIRVQKATEVVPEPVVPEVKQQQPLVPPQFTAKLKNRTTEEGATVHLKCSVTGFPEPTYRWFKDGKEITDGLGVKLRNNDGFLSLEIARVKQSLAGEYTVEASNSEGIISSSCILQVEGDKEIEPLELDIVRPKFIRKIQDLHVKQGEDAIFTCTATGKPMPEFKWHRDMINITASDLVVIEFNNQGRAQMTLKKVKPSDYGLYNCVAQSRAGRAKCSAYLHVTERTTSPDKEVEFAIMQARKESSVERANNLGSPPSLVLMLPDTLDIVVGGKLKLDSSVQGYPMPLVTWHKGDRGLMYSQRHRIVPCGSLHTMEIPQVMALDKGEYIVRATNIYGTVQSSCYVNILPKGSNISAPDYTRKTLVVEAKENLIAPYFVKHLPKTIDALLGMNIRLDCILREGIELIKRSQSESTFQDLEKDKKELVDEGFHGEFIPLEAKSKDKSRSHSEDKKQSEVVINKPSKQEETIAKAINFTTTLKDLVQPAGSEVIFECSTSGATEPEVKWYKDGKELVSNNRIIVVAAGSKHTLRIADVRSTDEGVYTCKLPQVADNISCSAALTVTEEVRERTPTSKTPPVKPEQKPTSDKKSPQSVLEEKIEKPEVYVPPSFSETLPKTTAAKHGDNVELTCQLASPDVASVEWELDGTQLQGEARYLASSDESNSRHKLTIQSVTGQDSGKYTCLVYLKNGDFVQTATQLIVTAAKPTPVQKKEEVEKKEKPEIYVPPSFSETLPKTTAAKHGDNVELACQLASPDVASVKWELDGTQLPEEARYLASSDESNSRHKLTIQSVTGQDSGKYTCVVYLKNGDLVHTSTQLIVTAAKPTPVQKNEDVKPHFTTKLTDTVVKDGEGLTLECDIEGNPRPQILWLRDDVEVFDSSDFQISTIGCHCKLQVTEIYPEDEGNYTCRAMNALGEATSTCYVSVEAQGDKKKSKKEQEVSEQAPELVVKPRRQFIDDGGKAKFKSSFDGSQNTKLFWSKNGQVLKESENILMYEADGFHFLEVKKVSAEDVGMYSVTVQNSAGSETAEAELEVFEKPKLLTRSGPEWEQSLQDLTVEEDDTNVKLVCTCKELTQPSVRWYHNGKEVFSGFHMKLQHEAQTATLTIKSIQEKDAGEFKCVMTGKNGELETSCILSIGSPEILEPPVFEKELHDMEVDEGDKLELDVEVKVLDTGDLHRHGHQ
jgi:titin